MAVFVVHSNVWDSTVVVLCLFVFVLVLVFFVVCFVVIFKLGKPSFVCIANLYVSLSNLIVC